MKVRLTRDSGSFVVCPCCNSYKLSLRRARTLRERARIKYFRTKHLQKQRAQREKYYKHRRKAIQNPKKYLSIIIDGMDQKKTNCPNLGGQTTKDEAPLKTRIIGVKVHGIRNYAYIADETVPGGGNLILEVLRLTLNDLQNREELPSEDPVLYLQIDNCGENKNKVMFSFLTDLVRRGIFSKVKAGFLMVGHTHEDIDQLFSTIAHYFKAYKTCCADPESLAEEIRNAFTDAKHKPTVVLLHPKQIFDYKKLYAAVLDPKIKHHQEPHQFVIKEISGVVLLRYKFWASSAFWLPMATKVFQFSNANVAMPSTSVGPDVSLPISHSDTTNASKRRKMERGQLTHGQRAAKARSSPITPDQCKATVDTTEDNLAWIPFEQNAHTIDEAIAAEQTLQPHPTPGIRWISASPNLNNAPYVTFSQEQHQLFSSNAQKIYDAILRTFVPKYKMIFQEPVLSVWKNWLLQQQQLWSFSVADSACATLVLPPPFATRRTQPQTQPEEIEDCAPEDPEETLEIITHDSGIHGIFTDEQRLGQLRTAIATAEQFRNVNALVELKKACIFIYCHLDVERKQDVYQIGVGIIEHIHGDPADPKATFDIRFCPPKGALPAKGVLGSKSYRADTLYQDITCSMCFNQHYTTKRGAKIESENRNTEKASLLAFNLILNRNGGFCKNRHRQDSIYNLSSYEIAQTVIQEWNTPDRRKEITARIAQNV